MAVTKYTMKQRNVKITIAVIVLISIIVSIGFPALSFSSSILVEVELLISVCNCNSMLLSSDIYFKECSNIQLYVISVDVADDAVLLLTRVQLGIVHYLRENK